MWKKEKEEKNGVLLNKYGNKQGEKTVELKKKKLALFCLPQCIINTLALSSFSAFSELIS